jgi:hypothetical protein
LIGRGRGSDSQSEDETEGGGKKEREGGREEEREGGREGGRPYLNDPQDFQRLLRGQSLDRGPQILLLIVGKGLRGIEAREGGRESKVRNPLL